MVVWNALLGLAALLLLLPCTLFAFQVLVALFAPKILISPMQRPQTTLRVCILMPAHNEAGGICKVLHALLPQLNADTHLLVVADNCTDNTAAIVREVAQQCPYLEVIERHNTQQRGKGYALDHGVRHLASMPPAVVLVLDADCAIAPGSIQTLTTLCIATQRPTQSLYLMHAPSGSGAKTQLAEFAWLVKNQARPLGFHRLGLPCQLMGTGMAFTWQQISNANLGTGHIVEDMQLGVDLAMAGTPPLFCPDALVTSEFPNSALGIATQRTRWEHGHLGVIVAQVPALLWRALGHRSGALLAMALDLCVPPLALLTLLCAATFLASLALSAAGGASLPLLLSAAASGLLLTGVACAWFKFGRRVISFWQLAQVPVYVIKKVPLYFYFLIKRQTTWVRSKRDGES